MGSRKRNEDGNPEHRQYRQPTRAGLGGRPDHQLVLAKDGEARKLAPLLGELGERARLGTIRQAADFGEAVLFSVYWPRAEAIIDSVGDALDGKVVIETMNPLGVTGEFVHFHDHDFMRDNSTAEYLQKDCLARGW